VNGYESILEKNVNSLVSVILISYNHAEYVTTAVESVFNQTYKNWELIIMENGSTDGSQKLLQKYENNPKVRIVYEEKNIYPTNIQNKSIKHANGDFISFLASDDYYLPEKLERQMKCFEGLSFEWGIVYSPAIGLNVFTGEQRAMRCITVSGYILKDIFTLPHSGLINCYTPLIRKECLERYTCYDDLWTEGEGLFLKIAMKYKFYFLDGPVLVMREHARNERYAGRRNCEINQTVFTRLMELPEFPKEYIKYVRARLALNLVMYGWQELRLGTDAIWARQRFYIAVSTYWKQLFNPRTIIGVSLSFLPEKLRVCLNNSMHKVRGHNFTFSYTERNDA